MKKIIFLLFVEILFLYAGCSYEKKGVATPEEVIERLADYGNSAEIIDLYSDKTVELFETFVTLVGMDRQSSFSLLNLIPSEDGYKVIDKHGDEKNCIVSIQYTGEEMGNSRGLVIKIKMVKSSGYWKIDRADDFKKMVDTYSKITAKDYVENLRER